MKTELISIVDLQLDPHNSRKHPDKNLAAIKGSLSKFGQQKPIVIDKNNIVIAGNGTLQAAEEMGWTEILCIRSNLEGSDRTAFAIADNRTADLAEWDYVALHESLIALNSETFDIGDIGFDIEDMDRLFGDFDPDLPDEEPKDQTEGKLILIVQCGDQEQLDSLFSELNGRGFKVKI